MSKKKGASKKKTEEEKEEVVEEKKDEPQPQGQRRPGSQAVSRGAYKGPY